MWDHTADVPQKYNINDSMMIRQH